MILLSAQNDKTRAARLSLHQQHRTAALDLARYFPVHVCWHTGNSTRKNFAALGNKFLQKIRVLIINRLHGDIDPPARHGSIGASKCRTAFWSFRLHVDLLGLPVQCSPPQKWVVFFLLQTIRRSWALFIARRHVTRRRLAKRLSFGAFKGNNLLCHKPRSLLRFRWSSFLLLRFSAFLLS